MKKIEFIISPDNAGERIDIQTARLTGLSRSKIQRLIQDNLLKVNNLSTKQNYKTRAGDIISVNVIEDEQTLIPEDLSIPILYMDDSIVVIDKPAGMVVYPAAGHSRGTLMNAVAYYSKRLANVGSPLRPGVVHRLDRDTSGVIVVALSDMAYYSLIEQFRKRTITRRYKAIVHGDLKDIIGIISLQIGRSVSDRKKMSTRTRKGKEALTSWKVVEQFKGATLIEAKLGTGRTHQIRVHFASIGHPVLGDRTYGNKTTILVHNRKISIPRQMLHAEILGFLHPTTNRYIEFRSQLPEDMKKIIELLRSIQ